MEITYVIQKGITDKRSQYPQRTTCPSQIPKTCALPKSVWIPHEAHATAVRIELWGNKSWLSCDNPGLK